MRNAIDNTALRQALRAARRLFVVIGGFSFFINILMLVGPLYMLQVYDRVLTSRSYDTLMVLTVLAVGLIAISGLLELVRSRLLGRLGNRLDEDLNGPVFSALIDSQLRGRTANGSHFLRDVDALRNFLTGPGLTAFFDAPWTPIFILVIFLFHPLLGVVALIGAILLFALAVVSELITRGPLQRSTGHMLEAHEFANSALRNVEAIRAMGMAGRVRARWLDLHGHGLALQGRATDRAGTLTAMAKFIRPCLQIAMLGVGAWLALQDIITPGVMIAAAIIMGRALAPVESAINNWRQFIATRGAHARLKGLLEANPPIKEPLALPAPVGQVHVTDVMAMPPKGNEPILQGISFDLSPGQMLGVVGPSAAGKSTLARVLVGVWPAASGDVRIDGAELAQWSAEELGKHIGYLPQDVELFAGTVAENIARLNEPDAQKVIAAAQLCDAHDMILQLPDAYDTQIGEGGCVLSGGQRQRIALARALYDDPCFIVLDEPNASLDSDGEVALHATLKRLKEKERSIVIISHRPAVLTAVDYVMVLRGGRMETVGSRDDVMPRLMGGIKTLQRQSRAALNPQQAGVSSEESAT